MSRPLVYVVEGKPLVSHMDFGMFCRDVHGKAVVVGAGFAGLNVAKELSAQGVSVTLIDPKSYWDYTLASPRLAVGNAMSEDAAAYAPALDKICEHLGVEFLQATVSSVVDGAVTLGDGIVIEAQAVVIAVGRAYAGGAAWKARADETTAEARKDGLARTAGEIAAAQSVVVAGAGLVGCEVAGEVRAKHPEKSVTLVGATAGGSAELRRRTDQALADLGVIRVAGRCSRAASGAVTVEGGDDLPCDCYLDCTGTRHVAGALVKDAFPDAVAESGAIVAEATLLLKGAKNVFAVGECLDVPAGRYVPPGGVAHAEACAATVAANVARVLSGEAPSVTHNWSMSPVFVPCVQAFGPDRAAADFGGPAFLATAENFLGKKVKCGGFFMFKMGPDYGRGKTW